MANGLRLFRPSPSSQAPVSIRTRSIRPWIGLLSLCALAWIGLATTVRDAYAAGHAAVQETDTDEDGMPNDWELFFGLNPNDPGDADDDPDSDGITNAAEYAARRHPFGHHVRYFAEGATGFFDTSVALINLSPPRPRTSRSRCHPKAAPRSRIASRSDHGSGRRFRSTPCWAG